MQMLDALNRLYYDFSLDELRRMNGNTLYSNISYNSLLYLDLIWYRENCTVSSLAEALHISKSAVTAKINELIRQKLVTRTQSEADRRVYYLSVSPEVKTEYSQFNKRLHHAVQQLTTHCSAEEVEVFCRMLDLIRESYLMEPG